MSRPCSHPDGHFYSPVVDPDDIGARQAELWPEAPVTLGIDYDDAGHAELLDSVFPQFLKDYDYPELAPSEDAELTSFYTRNSQFSWLDSRALFVLMRAWRPARIIEVGSGYSSLLMGDVNNRFLGGSCDIACIEPYPRPFLRNPQAGIGSVLEQKVQELPLVYFDRLGPGDILFIDSSHVTKTGSDVNYLFFEVLPRLARGVRVHIHDIFLPFEYPKVWVIDENRSWNEQYLVRALLMFSHGFRVRFGSSYAHHRFADKVRRALAHPEGHALGGGSLWIERT